MTEFAPARLRVLLAVSFIAAMLSATAGVANAAAMTPLIPGFRQTLHCNGGTIAIAVATKRPKLAPDATEVITTLTLGDSRVVTRALRAVDAAGNIDAIGYVFPDFVKRFPRRRLLPASPPARGSTTSYFNVSGAVIQKRYEGAKAPARGAQPGYVFSDYSGGHKLNTATYVPGIGLTSAVYFGLNADRTDLVCHAPGF